MQISHNHQPKTKLHYQTFTIPSLDAAPNQPNNPHEPIPIPTQPSKTIMQIPSKQILPNDYKDYLKKRELEFTQNGSLILNSNNLKLLCIKQGLYQFPQLNTKLYLHFKCIEKIVGLQEYVNLKTLYLENNVIKKIQGLGCLPALENLFLQHNMITKIQNLEGNKNLLVINLSYNNIFVIEGLSCLPYLQNLTITNNYMEKFQDVAHLGECASTLTSIDLSSNRIIADQRLFDIVSQVKCLYLSGNPLVREMQHYRRTVIGKLKNLLYLDQRAVAQEERLLAEKWVQQGAQGMKKAKAELQQKKQQKKQEQKKQLMKDINSHRSKKIIMFKKSITELQQQISKLREYQSDPSNSNMEYYYESQIFEKEGKIREFQDFIQNITCRIEGREPPKPKIEPEQKKQEMLRLTVEEGAEQVYKNTETQDDKICQTELKNNPLNNQPSSNNQDIFQSIKKIDAAGMPISEQQKQKQQQQQHQHQQQMWTKTETETSQKQQQSNKSVMLAQKNKYSYDELD